MLKTTKLTQARRLFWTSVAPTPFATHAAFAALDVATQHLLEAALFDGLRCTDLAHQLAVDSTEIRCRLAAAMRALHAALIGEPDDGAVAAMLALHALDALDPDEAALVDTALACQPALRRIHGRYCELVGELCLMVPAVDPPPRDVVQLCHALEAGTPMR